MNIISTNIADVLLLEPNVFGDARGFFYESYNQQAFADATGIHANFVQDNHSCSAKHVLRGLHYQIEQPQGKLVRVIAGAVLDVVVDLRKSSASFGHAVTQVLSAENKLMLWVPAGFAHGFLTLEDNTEFLYKTTDFYAPAHERCVLWNDPQLAVDWQLQGATPRLSAKDELGVLLTQAEVFD